MTPAARRRNIAPPRESVLAAAMATIAERGLDGLTMAGLGREVGMSSGHLLYYFRTKDELLLRTLEWSEGRLGAERSALLSRQAPTAERLDAYVDLYVPDGPRDPHWTLWLEVWNRSQNADDEARARQAAIEGAWHRDLVALLAEGISRGEFRARRPRPLRRPPPCAPRRLQRPRRRRHPRHRTRTRPDPCQGVPPRRAAAGKRLITGGAGRVRAPGLDGPPAY